MESVKTNEEELTSTMGDLLSSSKEEKNDTCDSTPTSSTDAFTTSTASQIAVDDTISSTSSDNLAEKATDAGPSSTVHVSNLVKQRSCSIVSENDLIAMNITDVSTEKITENVDDIVQDLENLLGEPTTSIDFPIRPREVKRKVAKDIAQEIDEFSVELQMLQDKCNETNIENPSVPSLSTNQDQQDTSAAQSAESQLVHSSEDILIEQSPITVPEDSEVSKSLSELNEVHSESVVAEETGGEHGGIEEELVQNETSEAENSRKSIVDEICESAVAEDPRKEHGETAAEFVEEEATNQTSQAENSRKSIVDEICESAVAEVPRKEHGETAAEIVEEETTNQTSEAENSRKSIVDEVHESQPELSSQEVTMSEENVDQNPTQEISESSNVVKENLETEPPVTTKGHVEVATETVKTEDYHKSIISNELNTEVEQQVAAISKREENMVQDQLHPSNELNEVSTSEEHVTNNEAPNSEAQAISKTANDLDEVSPDVEPHEMAMDEKYVIHHQAPDSMEQELSEPSSELNRVSPDVELHEVAMSEKASDSIVQELPETLSESNQVSPKVEAHEVAVSANTGMQHKAQISETSSELNKVDPEPEAVEIEMKSQTPETVETTKGAEEEMDVVEIKVQETHTEQLEQNLASDSENKSQPTISEANQPQVEVVKSEVEKAASCSEEVSAQSELGSTLPLMSEEPQLHNENTEEEMEVVKSQVENAVQSLERPSCRSEDVSAHSEPVLTLPSMLEEPHLLPNDKNTEEEMEVVKSEVEKAVQSLERPFCSEVVSAHLEPELTLPSMLEQPGLLPNDKNTEEEMGVVKSEIKKAVQSLERPSCRSEGVSAQSEPGLSLPPMLEEPQLLHNDKNTNQEFKVTENVTLDRENVSEQGALTTQSLRETQSQSDTMLQEEIMKISEVSKEDNDDKSDQVTTDILFPSLSDMLDQKGSEVATENTELSRFESAGTVQKVSEVERENTELPRFESAGIVDQRVSESEHENAAISHFEPGVIVDQKVSEIEPGNAAIPHFEPVGIVDRRVSELERENAALPDFVPMNLVEPEGNVENEEQIQCDISLEQLVTENIPKKTHSIEKDSRNDDRNISHVIEGKQELIQEAADDDLSEVISELNTLPVSGLVKQLDILVENALEGETGPDDVLCSRDQPELAETSNECDQSNILPVVEDVPDLEVLNAISSLNVDKSVFIPDALLASSDMEQSSDDVSLESCIQATLSTVDEILTEQDQPQPVQLPDDNLETLLAVANLQSEVYTASFDPDDKEDSTVTAFAPVEKETVKTVKSVAVAEDKLKEPLSIKIEDSSDKDRVYSPRITIKPIRPGGEVASPHTDVDEKEGSKGSIKMKITKQSDNMHSILKIYNPDADCQSQEVAAEPTVPKLIIKSLMQSAEQPQSPKLSRSSKQVFSPSTTQRSSSPRITIKPIPKPDSVEPIVPKITIKPVLKPDEGHRQRHSPKLTIKPIMKPDDEVVSEAKVHSPRVTIKPIVKPPDEAEQQLPSPRITIKPIMKPETVVEAVPTTPRVTIKPVLKPHDKDKCADAVEQVEKSSPKITIKPIVKPHELDGQDDYEESVKERIVLKINKGTIPSASKERKRELVPEEERSEKLAKIKLKFSKEGGHPHIVQSESHTKRTFEQSDHDKSKRQKLDGDMLTGVTITPIPTHSKLKEMLCRSGAGFSGDKVVTIDDDDDDVSIVEETNKPSPIVISEESNQDSINIAMEMRDPISDIPVFEITPESVKTLNPQPAPQVAEVPAPAPRKRGRPRKVPLQVREDFKDPKEEEPKPVVVESTRPKRSCRGQSVRTTLGIKPRKPRGPGRGRGSKRGIGTRATPTPPEVSPKVAKEPKLTASKLRQQFKEDLLLLSDKSESTTPKPIDIDDGFRKSPLGPRHTENSGLDRADIVMYEEETRMSAETSSRAQTPAKQVVTSITTVDLVEESQSSIQSTATTESAKVRKGPRLEVHQEPEGAVISADQLAEYYWSGGGPFMLQEQVAQFLGIKSFKRKYPNIQRRVVDMQERDFIRESGLAGEAMCDLGLTAVNSTDILDIMYSDFQDKYEEYCKHQRDRQAKDLTNKQRALSLAASQEKTKMDITQQAVQSAANWNATFNKARRDQRKACMDLQTLTVHYPKGKMKQVNKAKIGHYPVALVPGQFTDYYRDFTPTEINNLPLNTLCYTPIVKGTHQDMECDSQTDGSGSESDSSSSDSDSSFSGSSDGEDCTLCKHTPKKIAIA